MEPAARKPHLPYSARPTRPTRPASTSSDFGSTSGVAYPRNDFSAYASAPSHRFQDDPYARQGNAKHQDHKPPSNVRLHPRSLRQAPHLNTFIPGTCPFTGHPMHPTPDMAIKTPLPPAPHSVYPSSSSYIDPYPTPIMSQREPYPPYLDPYASPYAPSIIPKRNPFAAHHRSSQDEARQTYNDEQGPRDPCAGDYDHCDLAHFHEPGYYSNTPNQNEGAIDETHHRFPPDTQQKPQRPSKKKHLPKAKTGKMISYPPKLRTSKQPAPKTFLGPDRRNTTVTYTGGGAQSPPLHLGPIRVSKQRQRSRAAALSLANSETTGCCPRVAPSSNSHSRLDPRRVSHPSQVVGPEAHASSDVRASSDIRTNNDDQEVEEQAFQYVPAPPARSWTSADVSSESSACLVPPASGKANKMPPRNRNRSSAMTEYNYCGSRLYNTEPNGQEIEDSDSETPTQEQVIRGIDPYSTSNESTIGDREEKQHSVEKNEPGFTDAGSSGLQYPSQTSSACEPESDTEEVKPGYDETGTVQNGVDDDGSSSENTAPRSGSDAGETAKEMEHPNVRPTNASVDDSNGSQSGDSEDTDSTDAGSDADSNAASGHENTWLLDNWRHSAGHRKTLKRLAADLQANFEEYENSIGRGGSSRTASAIGNERCGGSACTVNRSAITAQEEKAAEEEGDGSASNIERSPHSMAEDSYGTVNDDGSTNMVSDGYNNDVRDCQRDTEEHTNSQAVNRIASEDENAVVNTNLQDVTELPSSDVPTLPSASVYESKEHVSSIVRKILAQMNLPAIGSVTLENGTMATTEETEMDPTEARSKSVKKNEKVKVSSPSACERDPQKSEDEVISNVHAEEECDKSLLGNEIAIDDDCKSRSSSSSYNGESISCNRTVSPPDDSLADEKVVCVDPSVKDDEIMQLSSAVDETSEFRNTTMCVNGSELKDDQAIHESSAVDATTAFKGTSMRLNESELNVDQVIHKSRALSTSTRCKDTNTCEEAPEFHEDRVVEAVPQSSTGFTIAQQTTCVTPKTALDAVVKIHSTQCEPNFSLPWQKRKQAESTWSGFLTGERLIVSDIRCAKYQTMLRVKRRGVHQVYYGRVLTLNDLVGLCLLTVDDDDFWTDLQPLKMADLWDLDAPIAVAFYGLGNNRGVSVSKGAVLGFGVHYSPLQSTPPFVTMKTDLTVGAEFGGAVVLNERDEAVGIALGVGSNVGECELVAGGLVSRFVQDFKNGNGECSSIPDCGFEWQALDSRILRECIGMTNEDSGVLVTKVSVKSPAFHFLRRGDVISDVGGYAVGNSGMALDDEHGQGEGSAPLLHVITQMRCGDLFNLRIWRKGLYKTVSYVLPKSLQKVDSPITGRESDCFIVGGLVFVTISVPYLQSEYGANWATQAPTNLIECVGSGDSETAKTVLLSRVLKARVNVEVGDVENCQLVSFNGAYISSLKYLALLVESCQSRFLKFDLGHRVFALVREDVDKASQSILDAYGVPSCSSLIE